MRKVKPKRSRRKEQEAGEKCCTCVDLLVRKTSLMNIAAGEINPLSHLPSQTPNVDGMNQWYIFSVESQLVIFSHWALVGTTTGAV